MADTRTQDEIVARIAQADDDYFGFRREVLIEALDFEHAKQYLNDSVTAEEWESTRPGEVEVAARGYLQFAIGKIVDHRGISAGRSVEKLGEYAWLMGRDDVVAAMGAADYAQYGAPQVKAFAVTLGWPWPGEATSFRAAALERMASGLPCRPEGCDDGCGQ